MINLREVQDHLQTQQVDGVTHIYDAIRKKYVVLQPEELVRQLLVIYLTEVVGYPRSRFQLEKETVTNKKKGRYDIIIYDRKVRPWMLIECKAHTVPLSQDVVDQLSGYNHTIAAPYMMISNGVETQCYTHKSSTKHYQLLTELPQYES